MIPVKMQKISHLLVLLVLALLMVTIKDMAYGQTRSMEQAQERMDQQAIDESEERSISIEQPINEPEERTVDQPVADSIEQKLAVPEDIEVKKSKKISIMPAYGDGPGEVVDKQLEGTGLTFFPNSIRGNAVPEEILEDVNKRQSSEPPFVGGP
jgi:hypothetical protein